MNINKERRARLAKFLNNVAAHRPPEEYMVHDFSLCNPLGHSKNIIEVDGMPGSDCTCKPIQIVNEDGSLTIQHQNQ